MEVAIHFAAKVPLSLGFGLIIVCIIHQVVHEHLKVLGWIDGVLELWEKQRLKVTDCNKKVRFLVKLGARVHA